MLWSPEVVCKVVKIVFEVVLWVWSNMMGEFEVVYGVVMVVVVVMVTDSDGYDE